MANCPACGKDPKWEDIDSERVKCSKCDVLYYKVDVKV